MKVAGSQNGPEIPTAPSADDFTTASRKVVWITGASGGLGQALVRAFRARHWNVAAAGHRQSPAPEGPHLFPLALDISQPEPVQRAAQAIHACWGRIDVLINNAAVVDDAAVWQMTEAQWEKVIAVDLTGAFLCSRAAAQTMITQDHGHIINISSLAGRWGGRGQSNYSAAKAGLLGLTTSLARELGPQNIQVNAVLPGVLPTPMTARLTPPQLEALVSANLLRRTNAVDEVAAFIFHLAGMRNVSGQVFQLDSRIVSWT